VIAPARNNEWHPAEIRFVETVRDTSMKIVIAETDAGKAYIKPMGGCADGPHPLACELVGTRLAACLGLPVLDHSVFALGDLDVEMIREEGGRAEAGPAFATRAIEAEPWGGSAGELKHVVNLNIVTRLVVMDTLCLNWDRCPPRNDDRRPNYDNVLLVPDRPKDPAVRLLPIDYGECFSRSRTLSPQIAVIERVKSPAVYGLFEPFEEHLSEEEARAAQKLLAELGQQKIEAIVDEIPGEWDVEKKTRAALVKLICGRAAFLSVELPGMLRQATSRLFLSGGQS